MSNFFDAIGVADMEKVHSAVIGWMLSDKCEAFGGEDEGRKIRSELLQKIFGIKENFEHFDSIDSVLEWKSLDVLIVTTNNSVQKCWLIENKIKSSQHSDQLNRYELIINCPVLLSSKQYKEWDPNSVYDKRLPKNVYVDCNKDYCFLTLIPEEPQDNKWKNTTYTVLKEGLDHALQNSTLPRNEKHFTILTEYCECVRNLCDSLSDFLAHYCQDEFRAYSNVFTDGSLQKEKKSREMVPSGKYASFIRDNGLETIFQKCFLRKIITNADLSHKVNTLHETRGNAFIDFINQEKKGDQFGLPCLIKFGYQFQKGSFKVQILGEKNSIICPEAFISHWKDNVIPYCKMEGKITRINRSQKWQIPFLSITIKGSDASGWYKHTIDEIKDKWLESIETCEQMINSLIVSAQEHPYVQ